jgi:drug/metabolite transporter (DMT)-like permease
LAVKLGLAGFVQFGVMYVAYLEAFRYLAAFQVALFTIFTPLWVTLFSDLLERKFHPRFLACAALAVAGTAVVVYQGGKGGRTVALGFFLMQGSNLCFAVGQIWYVRIMRAAPELADRDVFGWMYLGGLAATLLACWAWVDFGQVCLTLDQMLVLAYLGLVASGLGFFLWNFGARQVNAGALAVMNNLKVPLGLLVSLVVFGEHADWVRLVLGGGLIALALALSAEFPHKENRDGRLKF